MSDPQAVVQQFREILLQERDALVELRHEDLAEIVQAKEAVASKLSRLDDGQWQKELSSELRQIAQLAEENRHLISFAKSSVAACMELIAGTSARYGQDRATARPLLVDTRG